VGSARLCVVADAPHPFTGKWAVACSVRLRRTSSQWSKRYIR
jgi:hypothetical protein